MKKMTTLALALVLALLLAACGGGEDGGDAAGGAADAEGTATSGEGKTVGIAMPTQSSERWVTDGRSMAEQFQALGYETDLQYAEDIIENQVSQIENMITREVDALVIAAIDGEALSDVLEQAARLEIPVISYDRLIRGSEHIDYYATFDNFQVGVQQGGYIVEALGLEDGEEGPFNIELFGGSPDDNNAYFFYDGAMSQLQPHIDSGALVVKSGQEGMETVSTLRWDGATAQARMDNLLSAHYTDDEVHAVLSPYDGLSIGIISALKGVGYGTADKPLPIITGQDAELASVKSIIAGEQTQTVFKDTRELARVAVGMVDAILAGGEPEINDTETYDNGVKVVPSYLLEPISVDIDNYEQVLVTDSGYYSAEDLQ
jgi:putative multiple sugar transport system substrate-binding protein